MIVDATSKNSRCCSLVSFREATRPRRAPPSAGTAIASAVVASTWPSAANDAAPMTAENDSEQSDVAAAFWLVNPAKRVRPGMRIWAPPQPTSPTDAPPPAPQRNTGAAAMARRRFERVRPSAFVERASRFDRSPRVERSRRVERRLRASGPRSSARRVGQRSRRARSPRRHSARPVRRRQVERVDSTPRRTTERSHPGSRQARRRARLGAAVA
mmetsp:Transcript_19667/g.61606  ORF Transcript_19667/g.61606 Transcript_19667/m.61606 type:complete len:214 (+) Transcript_19667:425-1066(+)